MRGCDIAFDTQQEETGSVLDVQTMKKSFNICVSLSNSQFGYV